MVVLTESAKNKRMPNKNTIIVVSGLPRSGTSLMMQILQKAGIPLLTDEKRRADVNNPRGYFEYQPVKKLKEDNSWLHRARGKALKIVSPLLVYLPDAFHYQIIFMQRSLDEIIASQNKMLNSRAIPPTPSQRLRNYLANHLLQINTYLSNKKNISVLKIDFKTLIDQPETELAKLSEFLGHPFNHETIKSVIQRDLYRTRIES